jgi:hypothetical protein
VRKAAATFTAFCPSFFLGLFSLPRHCLSTALLPPQLLPPQLLPSQLFSATYYVLQKHNPPMVGKTYTHPPRQQRSWKSSVKTSLNLSSRHQNIGYWGESPPVRGPAHGASRSDGRPVLSALDMECVAAPELMGSVVSGERVEANGTIHRRLDRGLTTKSFLSRTCRKFNIYCQTFARARRLSLLSTTKPPPTLRVLPHHSTN